MGRYDKYKDSGVEWLGEIPEHWEVKKLKYLAQCNPSNIDKKSKEKEQDVYLCNYVDVYKNEFIHKRMNFMKATANDNQIDKFILEKGDVIVTKDSESPDDIGNPALVIDDFQNVVCGYHLTQIKPLEVEGIYLFRFLQSQYIKSYFEVSANGVTRYGLGTDKFNSSLIICPPLSEQTIIANYLDKKTAEIDSLISEKEKLIKLYEEEKTAIINEAVTKGLNPDVNFKDSGIEWLGEIPEHWEVKRLRYLFEIKKRIVGELGYNVLSITQGGIKVKDIESKDGQLSSDYTKYQLVNESDFAMNHMDLLTGYVDISNYRGVTSPDYRVFSLIEENSLDKYFLRLFQMGYKNKIFFAFGRGAAHIGRWRFPAEEFKDFSFPVPPNSEQIAIVKHIESEIAQLDKKAEKAKQLIELLKEYKTSLISEVVTGKMKVI